MTTLCDCNKCKMVRLENETGRLARLERAHAWFVSQTDCDCVEWGCPVDGELHSGGYDDDDLSWRHAQGCEWIKARDLTL